MTIRPMGLIFAVALCASAGVSARTSMESVYTNLEGKSCKKVVDDKTTGAYTLTCPGAGKFALQVLDDDDRSSVNLVGPEKHVFELDYWTVVTPGFSSLGKKAEWRVAKIDGKIVPAALIVRVNGTDQSDPEHPKRVPLLAVAQIRKTEACVVKTIGAGSANANTEARAIADGPELPCLKSLMPTNQSKKG
ncbi:hypothetical protein [Massilia rubra]|uniref:Uncharacterized protein n=1 Tax=Massilia rubra TaxID=2607910 RepID=A0ABX0LGG3_9BURK|nr:hypothetical protein [Massilia rubra]NHZ33926.1 hypothetical protein [Massilia rubra]